MTLRRKSPLARGGRVKPKKRTASEFSRIYGSKKRVAWVKAQPCLVCGSGPCENAHVVGGGMGRKASHTAIVPLCSSHHWQSHHYGWDALGARWDDARFRIRLAIAVQGQWEMCAD